MIVSSFRIAGVVHEDVSIRRLTCRDRWSLAAGRCRITQISRCNPQAILKEELAGIVSQQVVTINVARSTRPKAFLESAVSAVTSVQDDVIEDRTMIKRHCTCPGHAHTAKAAVEYGIVRYDLCSYVVVELDTVTRGIRDNVILYDAVDSSKVDAVNEWAGETYTNVIQDVADSLCTVDGGWGYDPRPAKRARTCRDIMDIIP